MKTGEEGEVIVVIQFDQNREILSKLNESVESTWSSPSSSLSLFVTPRSAGFLLQ